MSRKFAFLVEYEDIPDDVDFTADVATPFMDALRAHTGAAAPSLVTVFTGDAAEAMIRAREGEVR